MLQIFYPSILETKINSQTIRQVHVKSIMRHQNTDENKTEHNPEHEIKLLLYLGKFNLGTKKIELLAPMQGIEP